MRYEEFAECAKWWGGEQRGGREATENAWKVDASEIAEGGYNLDLSNPHANDDLAHRPPGDLVDELLKTEGEILDLLGELKMELDRS
jgi:type I restriction enzyme M protein